MTGDEFSELLGRVKRLGGPVGTPPFPYTDHVMIGEESLGYAGWVLQHKPHEDHIVGVLKRDLEARGFDWETNGTGPCYEARVESTGRDITESHGCSSELEALLRAWIAAVEVRT